MLTVYYILKGIHTASQPILLMFINHAQLMNYLQIIYEYHTVVVVVD